MRRPARSLALGVAVIAAVLGFLIYQGISNNLVYYITPTELLAKGAAADGQSFRLGGKVKTGSIQWNGRTHYLRFVLEDTKVVGRRGESRCPTGTVQRQDRVCGRRNVSGELFQRHQLDDQALERLCRAQAR